MRIDIIYMTHTRWHYWECDQAQLEAATINPHYTPINLNFFMLWYKYTPRDEGNILPQEMKVTFTKAKTILARTRVRYELHVHNRIYIYSRITRKW